MTYLPTQTAPWESHHDSGWTERILCRCGPLILLICHAPPKGTIKLPRNWNEPWNWWIQLDFIFIYFRSQTVSNLNRDKMELLLTTSWSILLFDFGFRVWDESFHYSFSIINKLKQWYQSVQKSLNLSFFKYAVCGDLMHERIWRICRSSNTSEKLTPPMYPFN